MTSDKEAVEAFLLDSDELERLEAIVAEFNVLDTLGVTRAEIRHSNVLSWMLDPKGNHGLGDWFLRRFLMGVMREAVQEVSIFAIDHFDFSDVEIRREWRNIDIVLVSRQNRFVLALENKIASSEHGGQLARYKKVLMDEFPDFRTVLVFLSPGGETPSDEDWLARDHGTILELVERTIDKRGSVISPRVLDFLEQYSTSLRRYVVGDSEIEQICRNIYRKHQKALDLIFEYRPDVQRQLTDFIRDLVRNESELVLDSAAKTYVRFTTKKLEKLVPAEGSGWSATGRVLLFEFTNYDKKVDLRLIIGPATRELREQLHSIAKLDEKLFNRAKRGGGEKWSSIYQKEYARPRALSMTRSIVWKSWSASDFVLFFKETYVE